MPEPISSTPANLRILKVRGRHVVLDSDLAALYGVSTKAFNQAVKRNRLRFPRDFSFALSRHEFQALRSQIVTAKRGGRRTPPRVFTEHGAIMAAAVLNSPRAIQMSVYVVRAFVRMRHALLTGVEMEKRLREIERVLLSHDEALRDLYRKVRPLLLPALAPPRRAIGFGPPKSVQNSAR